MSQPIPIFRSDDPIPLGRAVEQVNMVEVTNAKEGLVIGPNDVLVLSFPGYTSVDELEIIRRSLMNAGLGGRFVLIGGQVNMSKIAPIDVPGDHRSRYAGGPGAATTARLLGSSVEGEVLP